MSVEEILEEFDVGCPVCDLRGAIRAAIAAERERCAKVAESCATKEGEDWNNNPGQGAWDSACDEIAAHIRNSQ